MALWSRHSSVGRLTECTHNGAICKHFVLELIQDLTFHEDLHRYRYQGQWLAESVSGVVSFDMSPRQREAIERTKDGPDGWAVRGETIHGWLEGLLKGVEPAIEDRWTPWLDPLRSDPLFADFELLATEYRLCDAKRSVGGSFDFLLRRRDSGPEKDWPVVLGDLKTVSSRKAVSSRKPATAQLGAYLSMMQQHHPRLWISECVTVVAGPERCRVIQQTPDECAAAWEDAWGRFECVQPDF